MPLGLLLAVISLVGYASSSSSRVNCLIINLEYVNCTWNEQGSQMFNYTFYRKFNRNEEYKKCPWYFEMGNHTFGCRFPYSMGQKFSKLHTLLTWDNSSIREELDLQVMVKLNPPYNLTVELSDSPELWLYWNVSSKPNCIESQVRYRKNNDNWQVTLVNGKNFFTYSFPSKNSQYTFQARNRVESVCAQSKFWSEWSTPVLWGQLKNDTVISNIPEYKMVLYFVIGSIVFIALIFLLIKNERLRVILIPIVPNPGKSFDDLIYTYNWNVEDWLHISKEFVEGFKPNFSEPVCPVQEYKLIPETSLGGSERSLSILTDQSDCTSTSCSTSTSTCTSTCTRPESSETPMLALV